MSLQVGVVGILVAELPPQGEGVRDPPGLREILYPLPIPLFEALEARGLLLKDRFQPIQQDEQLVGLEISAGLTDDVIGKKQLVVIGRRLLSRCEELGGPGPEPLLERLMSSAHHQDGIAHPRHPGLVAGEPLGCFEMLMHSVPLLAGGELRQQRQACGNPVLLVRDRLPGLGYGGERLGQNDHPFAPRKLGGDLLREGLPGNRVYLDGGQADAPLPIVQRFNVHGPPPPGRLDEVREHDGRQDLGQVPVLDPHNHMPLGVDGDPCFVYAGSRRLENEDGPVVSPLLYCRPVGLVAGFQRSEGEVSDAEFVGGQVRRDGGPFASELKRPGEDAPPLPVTPVDQRLAAVAPRTREPRLGRDQVQLVRLGGEPLAARVETLRLDGDPEAPLKGGQ